MGKFGDSVTQWLWSPLTWWEGVLFLLLWLLVSSIDYYQPK